MISVGREIKVWIFVSLCSLFLWVTYWLVPSFAHLFNIVLGLPDYYASRIWYFMPSHVGLTARFIGVFLALVNLYLVWSTKAKSFSSVKTLVAASLLLEGVYFGMLTPSAYSLMARGMKILGIAYFLQVLLTMPFLAILAVKIKDYKSGPHSFEVWKWVGVAFSGYVAALWANAVMRWFDMFLKEGPMFLLSGIKAVGFFNAVIFMSLAVAFSVAGAYLLTKQNEGFAKKLFGLALAMVGLHYVIYVAYSYVTNTLNFALLVDIWAIPLLGLGLTLLKTKTKEYMYHAMSPAQFAEALGTIKEK